MNMQRILQSVPARYPNFVNFITFIVISISSMIALCFANTNVPVVQAKRLSQPLSSAITASVFITITDTGFEPDNVQLKVGDEATFYNARPQTIILSQTANYRVFLPVRLMTLHSYKLLASLHVL